MDISDWEFGFVLPNLVLQDVHDARHLGSWPEGISFGPDFIAIVRFDDPRVVHMRSQSPAVEQILSSFVDEYGNSYNPAVLITRNSAPHTVRHSLEAIVAFRNSIALAIVLRARAAAARGYGGSHPTWSDTFDFHPAVVGGTGHMILRSPALIGSVSSDARLQLTHSPYLSVTTGWLYPDRYLLRSFGKAWTDRFCGKTKKSEFVDRVFRSLDVAYQACAIGAKNEGSLNDYGMQVALWVSAIEILAWPDKSHADLESVLQLLDREAIHDRDRKRRYRIVMRTKKNRKKAQRVSALQRAYIYIYRARNDFLHGNPVYVNTLLARTKTKQVSVPRLAAVVYRAALVAYLDQRYPKKVRTLEELAARIGESSDDGTYTEALAELFGYER